jgi:Protein of unknown function (DUF4235)
MSDDRAARRGRALLEATGLVAIYSTRRVMQLVWRRTTGDEPPAGPDDREVSFGRAVAWSLIFGALATTTRMIAIRYASKLLPRVERENLPSVDKPGKNERPDDLAI